VSNFLAHEVYDIEQKMPFCTVMYCLTDGGPVRKQSVNRDFFVMLALMNDLSSWDGTWPQHA
jgi:hypothetical protein